MFEMLHRDWNFKPIFTHKWASVDMNWGEWFNPNPPAILTLVMQQYFGIHDLLNYLDDFTWSVPNVIEVLMPLWAEHAHGITYSLTAW